MPQPTWLRVQAAIGILTIPTINPRVAWIRSHGEVKMAARHYLGVRDVGMVQRSAIESYRLHITIC